MSEKTAIIIPCYNDGKLLIESVESAKDQTVGGVEIIVVDDGSTDEGTKCILENIGSERVRVIHQKHEGPAAARNRGIREAKAKYILPLDADDMLAAAYVEKAEVVLDGNSNIGIVYCSADYFGDRTGAWRLPEYSFPEILNGNVIFTSMVFRKRDWEAVGGYNKNMREGWEDYDFVISLVELGVEVYKIPEVLFYYRYDNSSRNQRLTDDSLIRCHSQIIRNHPKLYLEHIDVLLEFTYKNREENEAKKEIGKRINNLDKVITAKKRQLERRDERIGVLESQLERYRKYPLLSLARGMRYGGKMVKQEKGLRAEQESILINKLAEGVCIKWKEGEAYDKLCRDKCCNNVHATENQGKRLPCDEKIKYSIVVIIDTSKEGEVENIVGSVVSQLYKNWELYVIWMGDVEEKQIINSGDERIKVIRAEEGKKYSWLLHRAINDASGTYVVFLENSISVSNKLLTELTNKIQQFGYDFLFSDNDYIDAEGRHCYHHFKADFSPEWILSENYISPGITVQKELLQKRALISTNDASLAYYDLILKCTLNAQSIYHIKDPLIHNKLDDLDGHPGREIVDTAGKLKVLKNAIQERGLNGKVSKSDDESRFEIQFSISRKDRISILISAEDVKAHIVESAIVKLLKSADYDDIEVIIGLKENEDGISNEEILKNNHLGRKSNIIFIKTSLSTWAEQANMMAHEASGQHLLFTTLGTSITSMSWVTKLLPYSQRDNIGTVGPKIYDQNDKLVYDGGVLSQTHGYFCVDQHLERGKGGYWNRVNITRNVTVNSRLCMMICRTLFMKEGGFDTDNLTDHLHDADLCLRLIEDGYLNVYVSSAEVSISNDLKDEFHGYKQHDIDYFTARHQAVIHNGDYYFNDGLLSVIA